MWYAAYVMHYALCGTACGMCDSFNTERGDFSVFFLLSLPQNNQIGLINQPSSQPSNQSIIQPYSHPTKQPKFYNQPTNQPTNQLRLYFSSVSGW